MRKLLDIETVLGFFTFTALGGFFVLMELAPKDLPDVGDLCAGIFAFLTVLMFAIAAGIRAPHPHSSRKQREEEAETAARFFTAGLIFMWIGMVSCTLIVYL